MQDTLPINMNLSSNEFNYCQSTGMHFFEELGFKNTFTEQCKTFQCYGDTLKMAEDQKNEI